MGITGVIPSQAGENVSQIHDQGKQNIKEQILLQH
jgi:hypothetical protein